MKNPLLLLSLVLTLFSCKPNDGLANLKMKLEENDTEVIVSTDSYQLYSQDNSTPKHAVLINEKIETSQENNFVKQKGISEIPISKPNDQAENIEIEEADFTQIIRSHIAYENAKDLSGLKTVFSSKISKFKVEENISEAEAMENYVQWWSSIRSENKKIDEIIKVNDKKYIVILQNTLETLAGKPEKINYSVVYEFNKNGEINALYSN